MIRTVFVLGMLSLLTACAPRRSALEMEAQLGVEVDSSTGLFAYFSSMPSVSVSDLSVSVADRQSLEGKISVAGDSGDAIYPIAAYRPARRFAFPSQVASLLDAPVATPAELDLETSVLGIGSNWTQLRAAGIQPGTSFALGYIEKRVWTLEGPDRFFSEKEMGPTEGISYGKLADDVAREIQSEFPKMKAAAAAYGATSIEAVAVYGQMKAGTYGRPGIYLSARLVTRIAE